ncbi:hypothetical protein ACFCVO_11775 [Agromyces sp. NPDC056379]|uniref:hypothetical protein n=1 Tax=unclassified Agromyces TaxID=2639701 RepID=UPI0035DF22A5
MVAEKPIKVDAETDRLVSELAYFLGSTKKSVVRVAVEDFAAARGRKTRTAQATSDSISCH